MAPAVQHAAFAGVLMDSFEDLTVRARSGDEEAFRLIFERYARPIVSFIYDMVGQGEVAEDLAQETFVRAYRNLGALQDDAKLSMWLFGIARNVVRETLRSRRKSELNVAIDDDRVTNLSDNGLTPDGHLLNKELNRVIHDALSSLDDDKRQVFILKVFHHWSYEEIASLTGSSIPKLKTDLHRAKAEMRRHIRPYLEMSNEM